jgi:hypothetical protein
MIRYALTCDQDHSFDSWFQSAAAFDSLAVAGHVTCAFCGSPRVAKSLMAPTVRTDRQLADAKPPEARQPVAGAASPPAPPPAAPPVLSTPETPLELAMAALRRQIEENSEYVGLNFAAEARAIHDGDAPGRSIYGEANRDDARQLIEDGIGVAPLPFLPQRRVN